MHWGEMCQPTPAHAGSCSAAPDAPPHTDPSLSQGSLHYIKCFRMLLASQSSHPHESHSSVQDAAAGKLTGFQPGSLTSDKTHPLCQQELSTSYTDRPGRQGRKPCWLHSVSQQKRVQSQQILRGRWQLHVRRRVCACTFLDTCTLHRLIGACPRASHPRRAHAMMGHEVPKNGRPLII